MTITIDEKNSHSATLLNTFTAESLKQKNIFETLQNILGKNLINSKRFLISK
jgi:hypothetical protein